MELATVAYAVATLLFSEALKEGRGRGNRIQSQGQYDRGLSGDAV